MELQVTKGDRVATEIWSYGQETRRVQHAQYDVSMLMGIPASGGLLLSAGSAMARSCNSRPEQKLAHHTEETRHEDQLPSA